MGYVYGLPENVSSRYVFSGYQARKRSEYHGVGTYPSNTADYQVKMASGLPTLNLLLKRTTIDDHEEILRACNNTLKQSRNDVETKHIRIVALLKLDRYDDVLQALDEGGEELRKRAHLEHAYVLYKSGNLEQARALARQLDDGRGPRHVEAQAVRALARITL